jgi:hypothetical protein
MNVETGLGPTCEEVLDSLGAYALGALDDGEIEAIEGHLVGCPDCRAALNQHHETVATLATAVPKSPPSVGVRERLLANAGSRVTPALRSIPSDEESNQPIRAINRWILPAVSIAATLLLVGAGVLGVLLMRAIDQRDAALRSTTMLSNYATAGGEKITFLSQPVAEYEEYSWQGSLLTAPGKAPVVVVAGCPKSGEYVTYWVWFSKEGERTPAGKLTVRSNGSGWLYLKQELNLAEFDMIGITVVLDDEQRQDVLVAPLDDTFAG